MLGDYDHVISYGTDMDGCIVDGHVVEMTETLNFEWRYNGGNYKTVRTNITGAYNLENALAAVAVGTFYGVCKADICEAISEYSPTNSRSQIVVTGRNRLILDAYNANPSSMNVSIDNFASLPGDNKTLILGAMRELGSEQDMQHQAIMAKIANLKIDNIYLIGDEFKPFAKQFPSFKIVSQASEILDEMSALSNRYILIKGSRSNKLEILVERL